MKDSFSRFVMHVPKNIEISTKTNNYKCTHETTERSFISTLTSIELNLALDNGYIVVKVFKVWNYTEWDDDLFKSYIRDFMKTKIETSGWPKDCDTDLKKTEFLNQYKSFGIFVDPKNVAVNPGMRALSKLCLNSLWGKFGMRNNLAHVKIITNPYSFYELNDYRYDLMDCTAVSDSVLRVSYRMREDYILEHPTSNVVIAL